MTRVKFCFVVFLSLLTFWLSATSPPSDNEAGVGAGEEALITPSLFVLPDAAPLRTASGSGIRRNEPFFGPAWFKFPFSRESYVSEVVIVPPFLSVVTCLRRFIFCERAFFDVGLVCGCLCHVIMRLYLFLNF